MEWLKKKFISNNQGFEINHKNTHVCRLKKELHGLKKAPRALYGRIDGFLMSLGHRFLMSLGFTKSKADSNLYYKVDEDGILILFLYVDDLFLTREYKSVIECEKKLAA